MAKEITLEELSVLALQAGLKLTQDELQRLLPGVNRSRTQITELRDLMKEDREPAGVFSAQKAQSR
jgi:hypothetical protein